MGTDIHGHMEYRDIETGRWELVGDIAPLDELLSQSYRMFANLFGIRPYRMTMPFNIVEPNRGFPADTARPEMLAWRDPIEYASIHGFTYITGEELSPWHNVLLREADDCWSSFLKIMDNMGTSHGEGNVRAVVWFDS